MFYFIPFYSIEPKYMFFSYETAFYSIEPKYMFFSYETAFYIQKNESFSFHMDDLFANFISQNHPFLHIFFLYPGSISYE